jgi:SOS response regulatory protein OraA/RecX
MTDPFTAAKRDLEERDRVKMLADDARQILNHAYDWQDEPHEDTIRFLMLRGYSWNEARTALEYIDWEDSQP